MSDLSQVTAVEFLNNRLGLPNDIKALNINSSTNTNTNKSLNKSDKLDLTITASDTSYLILKDSIDNFAHMTSLVQVSKNSLSTIGNYLAEIKVKFEKLQSASGDPELTLSLNNELKNLEDEMSKYISTVIIKSTRANINISPIGKQAHQRYYNSVVNDGQFGKVEATTLAEIEVNLAHTAIKQLGDHDSRNCPICAAEIAEKNLSSEISGTNYTPKSSNPLNITTGAEVDNRNFAPVTNSTSITGRVSMTTAGISNTNVDAMISGQKWDLSSVETLSWSYYETSGVTYSYAYDSSAGVTAGNSIINSAGDTLIVKEMMGLWDQAAAFTLEHVTETSSAGGTVVGEIRMRETNQSGTSAGFAALCAFPGTGARNGDAWFNTPYGTPFIKGNYNWSTFLHEIGHGIGLSHPFGHSQSGATLSQNDDIERRSVMSYTSVDRNYYWATSGGSLSTSIFYAETPGIFDIQAVEFFYGTSTTTNLGDTTYSYDDKPVMLRTIVDSGGTDTIDASNQTEEVRIDLNGGTASSIGQWSRAEQVAHYVAQGQNSASLQTIINNADSAAQSGSHPSPYSKGWYEGEDNLMIAFSSVIENAKGGAKGDTITGNSAGNKITGNEGNDILDGAAGTDYAIFSGAQANYTITGNGTSAQVTDNFGSEGSDVLKNFEYIRFSDGVDYNLSTGNLDRYSWQNTKPDYAKAYKPVVRGNGSINVAAFPVLAKLNLSQLQSVATGQFEGDAKALFTEGLKTDAEIADALDALDELLKQISEQQTIIASAQISINENAAGVIASNTTNARTGGISQSLIAEVEQAGFVGELMTAIRAQIKGIIDAQVNALAPSTGTEVITLLG